tara:strand:- start:28336 stop:28758 length:423 start_codon:yes stop_codon:yes gene_type:complete
MYSSISNHDGVDYQSKLSTLKSSTSGYSLDQDAGNMTTIGIKKKFPRKILVGIAVFILAAGGAYAFLKFKNKNKSKKMPQKMPQKMPRMRDPRMQKTPPSKQTKKSPWVKQIISLVVLGLVAGLIYGGFKLYQKRKTISI